MLWYWNVNRKCGGGQPSATAQWAQGSGVHLPGKERQEGMLGEGSRRHQGACVMELGSLVQYDKCSWEMALKRWRRTSRDCAKRLALGSQAVGVPAQVGSPGEAPSFSRWGDRSWEAKWHAHGLKVRSARKSSEAQVTSLPAQSSPLPTPSSLTAHYSYTRYGDVSRQPFSTRQSPHNPEQWDWWMQSLLIKHVFFKGTSYFLTQVN